MLQRRLNYYRRIFSAYLTPGASQLTFWHERPEENSRARYDELGEYYMTFAAKADYPGTYDASGVPMLDYRGVIGLQYNPIAIAHYGLGNLNLWMGAHEEIRLQKALTASDWLVENLEQTAFGTWVWNHNFNFEYRTELKAPWYSGLAQGQGISLLLRAHKATGEERYMEAARRAYQALLAPVSEGGVLYTDESGDLWIEEYIVSPPTHILNGFIWATWGLHDYFLATGEAEAHDIFNRCMDTLDSNLHRYDYQFWSLYEQSGTWLKMLASPFYHHLHIVQLGILRRMTGREAFQRYADRWETYRHRRLNRTAALVYKAAFKLRYY